MLDNLDTEAEDTGLPDNRSVDEQSDGIVKRVHKARRLADKSQSYWRREARQDFAFLAGDQWTTEEKSALEELRRVAVVFNRIEPTIESIAGHEVNNRQAVKYVPRQPQQDASVNDLLTSAANWVRDQCDAEDEESDSFTDMLACGVGVTETTLDYENNPDGEVIINRLDPITVRWDPAARKRNLVDAAWVQHDRKMRLSDIRSEWPEKADELTAAAVDTLEVESEDEPHNATDAPYYKNDQRADEVDRQYRTVICHQWYDTVPFWRVLDPITGEMLEVDQQQFDVLQQAAQKGFTPPPTQSVKLKRRVYRTAYVCDNVLLDEMESLSQKGFSLNFMTGRRDRNRATWYGVVRPMRDPQRFANKYLTQLEALFRSNAKGGLLIEEDAVDNFRELEERWAQQDSVIKLNPGALMQGKIQPKPISPVPPGPERLLEFSILSIRDVTGVNLEALGLADREQAASLELQRRESALTILAPLFNSLRRYRKVQGRLLADLIVRYISDGRLIRITQGDGTEQSVPLLRMPETLDYDVVVDSSSNAPDQKRQTFAVLTQTIPALEKSGFPTPSEILDYVPLPQSLVGAWKKAIQAKQQQPPPQPPEVQKAQIQAQVDQQKLQQQMAVEQMKDQFARWKAQQDAQLELYKASLKAQTEAQSEQMRAAINEQSQVLNAQASQQKSFADTMQARIEGLAKLVEATSKVRAQAEKAIERGTRGPNVIAVPMPDGNGEMQAQALSQMAQAVQALQQSMNGPRPPLRVIRDAGGNIAGVQ